MKIYLYTNISSNDRTSRIKKWNLTTTHSTIYSSFFVSLLWIIIIIIIIIIMLERSTLSSIQSINPTLLLQPAARNRTIISQALHMKQLLVFCILKQDKNEYHNIKHNKKTICSSSRAAGNVSDTWSFVLHDDCNR